MVDSPALRQRGIKHVEEMQLFSAGLGPDRISDLTANLIKEFLISYTQRQCSLWKFPLKKGVPIENVFDKQTGSWYDGHFDLPISSHDGSPILLVPRRIVRALPWINYNDFLKMEFSTYLRAKRVRARSNAKPTEALDTDNKNAIVTINRREIARVDNYILRKEADKQQAQPSSEYAIDSDVCKQAADLCKRLTDLKPGHLNADTYQRLILEILNFLFNPELISGELEVRTVDGTERRDIIFTNDSDLTFWDYIRGEHSALLLMFETKNVQALEPTHFNQTATYLGDRIGRIGFIVTRNAIQETQQKKAYSIYNDSNPRKIILVFSDSDIKLMLDIRCKGNDPMRYVQKHYREFRQRVQ